MGELTSPKKVREILSRYHFKTRKSLGQNFLVDNNIISKIVSAAEITDQDLVVEIGPGLGVLTSALAQRAQKVVALELDNKLIPILEETLASHKNIEVVPADAMEVNFDQLVHEKTRGSFGGGAKGYKVVANLPYYITTPLIMHMLTNNFNINSMVLMMQREVARRLAAAPGNKDYGSLTVAVQYYTEASLAFGVPRTVFYPQPEVDSAVVKLTKRKSPAVEVVDQELFFKVVRAAFGKRRKTILNALSSSNIGATKEQVDLLLGQSGIDPKRRGETLTLEEFALLSNNFYTMGIF